MKKGRGAELYQRIIEFNEAAKSPTQVAKMHALGNTVYYGIKPNKHFFDDFIAYLKRDFARRPIILSQQISGIKKAGKLTQVKGIIGTLGVEKPKDGKLSSIVSPTYETTTLSAKQYISQHRRTCVGFASDHIETRYRTKHEGKKEFDYQGQELQESVTMAMLIGNVIAEQHLSQDTPFTPVFIPHKEGAFLGYASESNYGDRFRRIHQYIEKGVNKGGKNANKLETLPYDLAMRPDWDPDCTFHLLTFIPNHALSRSQTMLRQQILDTFDKHQETVTQLWDRFLDIMSENEPDIEKIKALEMEILDITTGQNWRKEIQHGQKHLPGNKWKPDGRHHS